MSLTAPPLDMWACTAYTVRRQERIKITIEYHNLQVHDVLNSFQGNASSIYFLDCDTASQENIELYTIISRKKSDYV